MKIVSYVHSMKLFVLDDGSAISVDAVDGASVGSTVTLKDGVYVVGGQDEGCNT